MHKTQREEEEEEKRARVIYFLHFAETQLVVFGHPRVFVVYTHHGDQSEVVDSCFSALIHVESEFEQLHRTTAFLQT